MVGCMKLFIYCSLFSLICFFTPQTIWGMDKVFKPLRSHLVSNGVKSKQADRLLNHSSVKYESKTLAMMLSIRESKLNYKQFLAKPVIKKAKKFIKQHRKILNDTKSRTTVPASVVVAILSVETRLGSYMGNTSVLNTLASHAVLDTKAGVRRLRKYWPKKDLGYLKSKSAQKRFQRKAKWGRGEVISLLKVSQKWKVSPHSLKGSGSGAMGMCQFVPTSVLRWGTDGDGDGKIDLTRPPDAIASVGTYLKHFGWKPGISKKRKKSIILRYNNSTPYARTVLKLAELLE